MIHTVIFTNISNVINRFVVLYDEGDFWYV